MKTNEPIMLEKEFILMVVYDPIQYDARVMRAAETINKMNESIIVISCNSDPLFTSKDFKSVVFKSGSKGFPLLISFWIYVIFYCIKHRKEIKLLYLHDYYLVFLGKIISKLININWVYDAHELLIKNKSQKYSLREGLFFLLEKVSVKNACLVVTANEERKRILKSIYKLNNVISVSNIAPRLKENSDSNFGKEDVIVYQGYLSEARNVSYFIKMLQYLPNSIKLKLIGSGPEINKYKSQAKELGLETRVVFTGMIPYSQILNESKNCKLSIVYYSLDGLNNYYCSPNKIYEYAQLGIPMFVSAQPFLKRIVSKYNIGEVLEPNKSIEEHAKVVLYMLHNISFYKKGMNSFLNDYTYQNEMGKLKESISIILNISSKDQCQQ